MLVKNILAVFAIAGMAAAYPTEDYEYEARDVLEERQPGPMCPPGHNWCCQNSVPFSFIFFSGAGSNCVTRKFYTAMFRYTFGSNFTNIYFSQARKRTRIRVPERNFFPLLSERPDCRKSSQSSFVGLLVANGKQSNGKSGAQVVCLK